MRGKDARGPVDLALLVELDQLLAVEPFPDDLHVAGAADLLTLRDLAPPVLFDSAAMQLVRGRCLVEAARRAGYAALPAIDLGEHPDRRATHVAAWDELLEGLASGDALLRALQGVERRFERETRDVRPGPRPPSSRRSGGRS